MVQFHVNAGSGGEFRGALMASSVKGARPGGKVVFTNDHPDPVDITEQADGAELFFHG